MAGNFGLAAAEAEATRLPVVEGFTAELAAGAGSETPGLVCERLTQAFGGVWEVEIRGEWVDARPETGILPLGRSWEVARLLASVPGVASAEPLLLLRVPAESEAGAARALWGMPYPEDVRRRIDQASRDDTGWSLAELRVEAAWQLWRARHAGLEPGAGIRIAHPDTGYTLHPQIAERLARRANGEVDGLNLVEVAEPTGADRLESSGLLPNPGHGTSTASVIVSRTGEGTGPDVRGVAPGAAILPFRVSTSVVHFSFLNVALALGAAVDRGAHVVSMSLGGPKSSRRLEAAVRRALDAGVIVVSAAGNMFPAVVFPAAMPGVIGVAASNPLRMPWRFSSLGEEVSVTAPGEQVWHARTAAPGVWEEDRGDGTSFATAAVAGIAALWLSFHGREALVARYTEPLLPFAYHFILTRTSDAAPDWIRGGKAGFGAGLADAEAVLRAALPSRAEVQAHRERVLKPGNRSWFDLKFREFVMLLRVPTRGPDGQRGLAPEGELAAEVQEAGAARLLNTLLGKEPPVELLEELVGLLAGAPQFSRPLARQALRPAETELSALRRALLRLPLSPQLQARLVEVRDAQRPGPGSVPLPVPLPAEPLADLEPGAPGAAAAAGPAGPTPLPGGDESLSAPGARRLRAYAFDPSLATRYATAAVNEVTISVPFERDLQPGPVGEYLEVVDVDPATDCAYAPVNLNHPHLLAQDGLAPSDGSPQFHQQMVYAVAMKTIRHFEEALGRPVFWAPLRPWLTGSGDDRRADPRLRADGKPDRGDRFVQRLRIYPHALREQNAYYSPGKRALLFGYFPAEDGAPGQEYPGGLVFTCLSHDIIAHETTHALLDGMHAYFNEPTNPDVYAFHEAFSDIVALFQHFSYPEVLRHQIAQSRGDLESEHLLGDLARQFGMATGRHHALRSAIGGLSPTPAGKPATGARWSRYQPDPDLLGTAGYAEEAHRRGSILVAAVFDAFLAIYRERVADLVRIATGGTGVLPAGRIHPDLVNRMADEAAKSAQHVLKICIRALDYTPPVDITFGEFLRALITADRELVPFDERRYRVAFVEAFRSWGIYPRDVRTLSEESLVWYPLEGVSLFGEKRNAAVREARQVMGFVRRALIAWEPGAVRSTIFDQIRQAQGMLKNYLQQVIRLPDDPLSHVLRALLIDESDRRRIPTDFNIANLRPARRIGPNGEFRTEVVLEIIRTIEPDPGAPTFRFRGGMTLLIGSDDEEWPVRYCIWKRVGSRERQRRQRDYAERSGSRRFGAAEYRCADAPADWAATRASDREGMRGSSCACRERNKKQDDREPFAMLHRGRGDESLD